MAGLNGGPHVFKDPLRAIQFALVEVRFEQLHFGILCLGDHGELQPQLFAGHQTTDQIGVEQKLL